MVVVAVKEAAFLLSMHPVIGGIKIQDEFLRCLIKGGDKDLHEQVVHLPGRFPIHAVFKSAECGGTAQTPVSIHRGLHGQVVAQSLVIVEIFVAQCETVHALTDQIMQAVLAGSFAARILQKSGGLSG